jgi:uncharacterized FlaG/YvyC family protein
MSEKQINTVSRVDMDSSNRLAQIALQAQEMSQKQKSVQKTETSKEEESVLEKVGQSINQKLAPTDTTLKFQIDDETNEITVLIVDRASEKVLHTIPADAIKNIPAGKLMQYFA